MTATDQKLAIFIDGNNVEMAVHENYPGMMVDYIGLIKRISDLRRISHLYYCREGKSISDKLKKRLNDNYHGQVVPCYKSADVPITIRAMNVADKVDCIILVSGDGDFTELVRSLKYSGCRVEICCCRSVLNSILLKESDYYWEILPDDLYKYQSDKAFTKKPIPDDGEKKQLY